MSEENNVGNNVVYDKIKKVRTQNKHLKPLKPGQTANPNGRPAGTKNFTTLYREAIESIAEEEGKTPQQVELELIKSGFKFAKGDYRYYRDTLDRVHGTATIKTDVTSGGKPIPFFDNVTNAVPDNNSNKENPSAQ